MGTTTTTKSGTKGTTKAPAKIEPNNLLKLLGSTTTTTTTSGTKGTTTVKQNSPVTGGGYIAPAPVPAAPVSPAQRVVYFYATYFLGNWNGVGYVCDQFTPSIEVVNIKYSKGNLYATKILGDACVPAKKLSFEAPLPGRLFQGLAFPVKLVIDHPRILQPDKSPELLQSSTSTLSNSENILFTELWDPMPLIL